MLTIKTLLGNIATLIINPLIILGFVIATIYFFYGIAELIWKADGKSEDAKRNVMYGVIGLFVMFSVYGLINIALNTFGIDCSGIFFCGKN
jgi:hypothetical protein